MSRPYRLTVEHALVWLAVVLNLGIATAAIIYSLC